MGMLVGCRAEASPAGTKTRGLTGDPIGFLASCVVRTALLSDTTAPWCAGVVQGCVQTPKVLCAQKELGPLFWCVVCAASQLKTLPTMFEPRVTGLNSGLAQGPSHTWDASAPVSQNLSVDTSLTPQQEQQQHTRQDAFGSASSAIAPCSSTACRRQGRCRVLTCCSEDIQCPQEALCGRLLRFN